MNTIAAIVSFIFLLALGSFLLKQGLHVDSAKDKMIKANARPTFRHYPKIYLATLGAVAIFADLYLAFRFFLK